LSYNQRRVGYRLARREKVRPEPLEPPFRILLRKSDGGVDAERFG
jgi:hypothetical protein